MRGQQASDPGRRRARLRELDIEIDQHVEIMLEAAEGPRPHDFEIADAAQQRDVVVGNTLQLLRRARSLLDHRRDAGQPLLQLPERGPWLLSAAAVVSRDLDRCHHGIPPSTLLL